jgi:hypothetical protein
LSGDHFQLSFPSSNLQFRRIQALTETSETEQVTVQLPNFSLPSLEEITLKVALFSETDGFLSVFE